MENKIKEIIEPNIVVYEDGKKETVSENKFHGLWMDWCCGSTDYDYFK